MGAPLRCAAACSSQGTSPHFSRAAGKEVLRAMAACSVPSAHTCALRSLADIADAGPPHLPALARTPASDTGSVLLCCSHVQREGKASLHRL